MMFLYTAARTRHRPWSIWKQNNGKEWHGANLKHRMQTVTLRLLRRECNNATVYCCSLPLQTLLFNGMILLCPLPLDTALKHKGRRAKHRVTSTLSYLNKEELRRAQGHFFLVVSTAIFNITYSYLHYLSFRVQIPFVMILMDHCNSVIKCHNSGHIYKFLFFPPGNGLVGMWYNRMVTESNSLCWGIFQKDGSHNRGRSLDRQARHI